jgi:hypothetical protein
MSLIPNNLQCLPLVHAQHELFDLEKLSNLYAAVLEQGSVQNREFKVETFDSRCIGNVWLSSSVMDDIMENLEFCARTCRRPPGLPQTQFVVNAASLGVDWFKNTVFMPVSRGGLKGLPARFLGSDGKWVNKRFVFPFQSAVGAHFVTVVIYATHRVVAIYDSMTGNTTAPIRVSASVI